MTEFVEAEDGVRIAYEIAGEGEPVVLVHGFASDRVQNWKAPGWYDTLTRAGRRVVALDFRGHGESDKPHDATSYGDLMFADIVAVMDAASVNQADVMGYSMGGMLTMALLIRRPDLVRRAIVAGVGASYFHDAPQRRQVLADGLEAADPATIRDPTARIFRSFASQPGKDLVALAACMRAERTVFTPAELTRLTHPVLVVCGEKDALTGPPEPLAAAFAHGRAVTVPDRDHMTTVGDKVYKQAVLEFLES